MTDDQLKQILAAIKALQKQCDDNDCSFKISNIETEVEQIKKDIKAIRNTLELRN